MTRALGFFSCHCFRAASSSSAGLLITLTLMLGFPGGCMFASPIASYGGCGVSVRCLSYSRLAKARRLARVDSAIGLARLDHRQGRELAVDQRGYLCRR